jgi:anti-sigma factor RsiW
MNNSQNCHQLDAYLSGDLSAEDDARFVAHLDRCPNCREDVDQQHWIDGLLQSPVGIQFERAPAKILESLHESQTRHRRGVLFTACGLAAAAALVIALNPIITRTREAPAPPTATNDVASTHAPHPPAAIEHATFVSTSESIAIPLESPAADVTVVQVYPTTDTERRWQLELVLPGGVKDTNGG